MATQFDLHNFLPRHIRKLLHAKTATSSKHSGAFNVLALDKNESAWGTVGTDSDYSKYPDSEATLLRKELSEYLKISSDKIMLGNGSDELIDLIMRVFTQNGKDHVLAFSPYAARVKHFAALNGLVVDEMHLNTAFQLSIFQVRNHINEHTKIMYISNPNPFSGICLRGMDMVDIIGDFNGIVIVDESCIGYQPENSLIEYIESYPNLVIVQSFSNVWGMAGLRLGVLFASPQIVEVLNKVRAPFNVNSMAQEIAVKALHIAEQKDRIVNETILERERLKDELLQLKFVQEVFNSDANYLLVRVDKPDHLIEYLDDERIYVYNATAYHNCSNCVRITVGSVEQNQRLLKTLREMSAKTAPARMFLKKLGQTLQRASVFLGFFKKIVG
jgi:histidinol-phosphate aminotransferase